MKELEREHLVAMTYEYKYFLMYVMDMHNAELDELISTFIKHEFYEILVIIEEELNDEPEREDRTREVRYQSFKNRFFNRYYKGL